MSLLSEIKLDQLQARKDKNAEVTSLLTTLIGEASMAGKNDGNRESTDLEVVAVIKKFIKGINEIVSIVAEGSGESLTALAEKMLLETYLPSQLTEDEISDIALKQISYLENASPKSMGKIMKHFKDNYAGQYDGKTASRVVKDLLSV